MNLTKNTYLIVGSIAFVLLIGLGWNYTEAIKAKNEIEREKIASDERFRQDQLMQEKEAVNAKIEADKEALAYKIQAEKDANQLKLDQQAEAAMDAKMEKYKTECKQEKKEMIKICNAGLNGYIATKCGDDLSCIQTEVANDVFCPKQNYESTCLDRKTKGLPTFETSG